MGNKQTTFTDEQLDAYQVRLDLQLLSKENYPHSVLLFGLFNR